MQCANCKAVIADKAIVCYRCGAPTSVPRPPDRPAARGRSWLVPSVGLAVVAVGVWVALALPPETRPRVLIALVAAALAGVAWQVMRRRRG